MLPKLKNRIVRHLILITFLVMLFEVVVFFWIQVNNAERRALQNADIMFDQIDSVLMENEEELEKIKEEYRESCLTNADTVSYILESKPEAADDTEELRKIAKMVEVDEIHIFNPKGTIIGGTNPEYYGYSVYDGEQIGFFEPMLSDRTLRLSQEATPNTAEGKIMQYSAVWSPGGSFILQVGMSPDAVLRATRKNELNYIFGLLSGGRGVTLYAVNRAENRIVGCTDPAYVELSPEEIGFDDAVYDAKKTGVHRRINSIASYCTVTGMDDWVIVYVVTNEAMYQNMTRNAIFLLTAMLLTAVLLVFAVTAYFDRFVIRSISDLNEELSEISEGALDRVVNIGGSQEFSELSAHINSMIRVLLHNNEKISYILNQTNLPVGAYEYNLRRKPVRTTERVPELLGLSAKEAEKLCSDYELFGNQIDALKKHPVEGEQNLYVMDGENIRYLKLEEKKEDNDVFGIIVDMTDEILMRRRAESERDIDMLTGVLTRRALKSSLEALFEQPEEIRHSLVCMIDADGLKDVNDSYGHMRGDQYLKAIANALSTFGSRKNLTGRLGGDEFVMFLYGYESDEELEADCRKLDDLQNNGTLQISALQEVPVRFSLGYVKAYGNNNSHQLLLAADQAMYENKKDRRTGPDDIKTE